MQLCHSGLMLRPACIKVWVHHNLCMNAFTLRFFFVCATNQQCWLTWHMQFSSYLLSSVLRNRLPSSYHVFSHLAAIAELRLLVPKRTNQLFNDRFDFYTPVDSAAK
jgi:hypothetical protein